MSLATFRVAPILACLFVSVLGCSDDTDGSGGGGGGDGTTTVTGTTTGVPSGSTTSTAGDGGSGGGVNPPACGDGAVGGDEACDDGNTMPDDGCDGTCVVESGWSCSGSPSECVLCGDRVIEGEEACDDGNSLAHDGCDATCAIENGWSCDGEPSICSEVCGDGYVTVGEGCDDGGTTSGDGCDATCVVEVGYGCQGQPSVCDVLCGDNIIFGGEACDDGNAFAGDGCDFNCEIEPGFTCSGEPSVCSSVLGDTCAFPAVLNAGANTVYWAATGLDYITEPPACSGSSVYLPDGPDVVMQLTAGITGEVAFSIAKPPSQRWHLLVNDEACGTISSELVCMSVFSGTELAGSFPVTAGQTYYFYIVDSTSGALPLSSPLEVMITETAEVCGDGLIIGNEACDDGDADSGDGCSSACTIEPTYLCQGEPSVCFVPPCAPGTNGMIGNSVTTLPTDLPTALAENYVAVDTSPTGWIYVGGLAALHRVPKAGGPNQNVGVLAGLTTSNLGYSMLVDGLDIYTVEAKVSGTTGYIWRISEDAGANWATTDYVTLPAAPTGSLQSATSYGGQLYTLSNQPTASLPTQLYKLPSGGTAPVPATLDLTFAGEARCSGLALDDDYLYAACGIGERLVRVDRVTGAVTVLTTAFNLDLNSNAVFAHDVDADGSADYLYFKGGEKRIGFVCDPGGASPYVAELATYGASPSASSYGMGFDPVTLTLYAFDDATEEIVIIQ